MQESNRAPQEYIAANSEKIRELGFKTPTLKFQNGDLQNLKFSVMDKLHKPLVAACKVVAVGNKTSEANLRAEWSPVLGREAKLSQAFGTSG